MKLINALTKCYVKTFNIHQNFTIHILCAFFFGTVLTLSFAPFDFIVAVPFSLLGFIHIIRIYVVSVINKSFGYVFWLRSFFIGFTFGFAHFLTSLYWISYSLLIEPDKFAWLIPIAVILIPLILSIFLGFFSLIITYFFYKNYNILKICILFAGYWSIIEFIRSYSILPFPWNLIGHTSLFSIYFAQIISIVGVNGAGFIIIIASTIIYSKKFFPILSVYSCVFICFLYGYYKIECNDVKHHDMPSIKLRIVQPNFQKPHFGNQQLQFEYLSKLVNLSKSHGYDSRELIIWPESSYPFPIFYNSKEEESGMMTAKILNDLLGDNISLIFGADRVILNDENQYIVFNSMFLNIKNQDKLAFYDKQVLVPFGEYIPFKKALPFIEKVASGIADFSDGVNHNILKINEQYSIVPAICFEVLFDLLYNNAISENVLFILNITNDLWFGDSIGPYQHFTIARIKAIEYGLPLVRVANTGMSAVIDCYGRVLLSSRLNTESVMDFNLLSGRNASIYKIYKVRDLLWVIILCAIVILSLNMKSSWHNIKILLKKMQ